MGRVMRSDHLPFEMPSRPFALSQEWRHLTFMHWEVSIEKLQPHIPEGLDIDLFDGKAYVGTIPFLMKNVRPRLLPSVPGISTFPEFNIRTYVKKNGKAGVLFLTLDAQSRVTCFHAPRKYGLPYRYAKCKISADEDVYRWESKRKSDGVVLAGQCRSKGELMQAKKGSLEEFLFERYSLYTNHKNKIHMAYTQHNPWQYKEGEVEIIDNTLTESYDLGIDVLNPEHVHMSDGVHVHTWPIQALEE
ncbi:MAG: DUF2071 domain-containing protein [Candidatus Poseidoniales archaeon]|nr:MAG: DUF2071 domain-containing protein [Candidatus Poseidoniales archaeon]|tara:strand:+ start:4690 stop:5427 length:738 start_codon:yes stop_codon:yes gene_type:complete